MSALKHVTDEIFTMPGLFSARECDEWLAFGESLGYEPALVNDITGQQRREEVRNNSRVIFDDKERAEALWQRIEKEVPIVVKGWRPIGLNERMRFYRYEVGEKFKWHADGCVRRNKDEQSLLTFMVYLNDGFTGGDTVFRDVRIEAVQGQALFFCHWLKHMGEEIREGCKYVLRSDIMYRRDNS